MIIKEMHDGTYTIVGITFAQIEDLISAYDSNAEIFGFPRQDDLSSPGDLDPLRELTGGSQELTGTLRDAGVNTE